MKSNQLLTAATLGAVATLFAASPAQALVVHQSQEMSVSVKTEGGNSSSTTEANAWGKQSQHVSTDEMTYSYRPGRHVGMGNRWGKNVWVRPADDGQVRLSWDLRGGTCHVRYTEAGASGYNYETSTNCDDGGITIGGLVSGKNYRFQVRKDDGAWTRAVTVKAW